MEKIITKNNKSTASPERIEELKRLIKNKMYLNSSINSLTGRMSKAVKIDTTSTKRSSCLGVNCDNCIDRQECDEMIKGRKIDIYV